MNGVTLVVARYNEPLGWLSGVPSGWRVVVYDKGGDASLGRRHAVVRRPNVGREAETFLWHNATSEPSEYTIYSQGNPFDHCPNFIQQATFLISRLDRVGWLGPHFDTAWNDYPHRVDDLGVKAVWSELFPQRPCPKRFSFPAGAQMVVRREWVLSREASFWRNAHKIATAEDWRVAHVFERLWPTLYEGT